jgi:hypothetical protein
LVTFTKGTMTGPFGSRILELFRNLFNGLIQ